MGRLLTLALLLLPVLGAQQFDFRDVISKTEGDRARLAVPDFRGDERTQPLLSGFNEVLWNDLSDAGYFRLMAKTLYPVAIPQQPSDLNPSVAQEWLRAPLQAAYLASGYAVAQSGLFRLRGWLADLTQSSSFTMLDQSYAESLDAAGARIAAHKFAADILRKVGLTPLFGTHIYFVRETRPAPDRHAEIWMMDWDGGNQRQISSCNGICTQPAVSPDGARLAFVRVYPNPEILMYSVDPVRRLPFENRKGLSAVASPSFSPDGKQLLLAQSEGRVMHLWSANLDGSNQRRVNEPGLIDVEPKVNPKTGAEIAFTSGRLGHVQLYLMNRDGADVHRLSNGRGEVSNPSWNPNGRVLAYAATKGVGAAGWNIFWMDVNRAEAQQLTHDEGRNENPVWAPDGLHLVFSSSRTGRQQIWTMLADGTGLRQLTTDGSNSTPVWGQ